MLNSINVHTRLFTKIIILIIARMVQAIDIPYTFLTKSKAMEPVHKKVDINVSKMNCFILSICALMSQKSWNQDLINRPGSMCLSSAGCMCQEESI